MNALTYKVALMGSPSTYVEWTEERVQQMKGLGFNSLQLNIAWGWRPNDEPLNLEDVVSLSGENAEYFVQKVPLNSDPSKEAWERRRSDMRKRIQLCKEAGMHSIFHFGAPFNGQDAYRDMPLDNCLLDGKTPGRYVALLEQLNHEFPGIDDILLYTYDQDAWLCNEFGSCEFCSGIPLHQRVFPFINLLADTWHRLTGGRLWWEPWELSAGQVLKTISQLNSECVGLALHSNIAEVTAALPVDRFVKNAAALALKRDIPVIIEGFFTTATEEVEPYTHIAYPLVTLKQVKAMANIKGAVGVKEYFGIDITKVDPNLQITSLFFQQPQISDEEAIGLLAEPYGTAEKDMVEFWILSSDAMELFPWDVSWYARKIGQCEVSHTMNAAFIRGQQCHTPSWESTRRATFMKTDDLEPDPWLLEDIQLRCELCAEKIGEAIRIGKNALSRVPQELHSQLEANLKELVGFQCRVLSYVYHLRETNLVHIIRKYHSNDEHIPERLIQELVATLKADQLNQGSEEPIQTAIRTLGGNITEFLNQFFLTPETNSWVKGPHSLTSR